MHVRIQCPVWRKVKLTWGPFLAVGGRILVTFLADLYDETCQSVIRIGGMGENGRKTPRALVCRKIQ